MVSLRFQVKPHHIKKVQLSYRHEAVEVKIKKC